MNAKDVVERIKGFEVASQQIARNLNLSATGKMRAEENLKESIRLFYPEAVDTLVSEWRSVRNRSNQLEDERRAEIQRLSSEWDFSKLAYETRVVSERLEGLHTFAEVGEFCEQVSNQGNRERFKALVELGPAIVRKRFSSETGAETLVKRMEENAASLLESAQLRKNRETVDVVIQRAVQLVKDTQYVREYYAAREDIYSGFDWENIFQGVRLWTSIVPETLAVTVHMEVVEEPVSYQPQLMV